MRYTLVTFLACPVCLGDLATILVKERPSPIPARPREASNRVAPEGAIVAPLGPCSRVERGEGYPGSLCARPVLRQRATSRLRWRPDCSCARRAPDGFRLRDSCRSCCPIIFVTANVTDGLFRGIDAGASHGSGRRVEGFRPATESSDVDGGMSYKRAEIGISAKVDDAHFFSPGYSSPFNRHNTEHTLYLIKLFGASVPLLELKGGRRAA